MKMYSQQAVVFSGFGGQGIMFIGQLLAYAAMDEGYHVTWIPSYGPEMRGGTANCFVVLSEEPIGSPVTSRPDIVAAFNLPSFDKFQPMLKPGGLLVVNSSLVARQTSREDVDLITVPATNIAQEIDAVKLTNMVMLGALLAARPILTLEAILKALEARLPAHHRSSLENNQIALRRGHRHAVTRHPMILEET